MTDVSYSSAILPLKKLKFMKPTENDKELPCILG